MALEPKSSRSDRERQKAAEKAAPALEPPFPFVHVPFDPFFFALEVTPLKPGEKRGDPSAL